MSRKVVCNNCGWRGTSEHVLKAVNPFDEANMILGCPGCKCIECFEYACDEPDCWLKVSCGTPTPDAYRSTCYEHRPK